MMGLNGCDASDVVESMSNLNLREVRGELSCLFSALIATHSVFCEDGRHLRRSSVASSARDSVTDAGKP